MLQYMKDSTSKLFKNRRFNDESSSKYYSSLKMEILQTPPQEPKPRQIEIPKPRMDAKEIMNLAVKESPQVSGYTRRE